MTTTYRWLVENFTKDGKSTGLYMACQVNMTVTADVNAARKFRRQITAEFRALDMREARGGDWRAVEHGFNDSETPNVGVQRRPAHDGRDPQDGRGPSAATTGSASGAEAKGR